MNLKKKNKAQKKYRHRIEIFKAKVKKTGLNQKISLVPYLTVHANIKSLYGKEYFAAKAIQEEDTLKFTMRYIPNMELNESMYIKYKDKIYDIKGIENIKELNEEYEIKARLADVSRFE